MRALGKHFAEFRLSYACILRQIQFFGLNHLAQGGQMGWIRRFAVWQDGN
jgi:hypothetical protein